MLNKIKSKYIFKIIFEYIHDEKFKYKFSFNSKYIQNKLELTLYDFQKIYFYSLPQNKQSNSYENFLICKKDIKEKYDKYIKSIDIFTDDIIKQMMIEQIIDDFELNNYWKIYIDIYSPLLYKCMSNNTLIRKLFIHIPLDNIIANNLINDYCDIFEEMNKSEIYNYENIKISFSNQELLDVLDQINIIPKKIKRLIFIKLLDVEKPAIIDYPLNYIPFINDKNIKENLIDLIIHIEDIIIKPELFHMINDYNSLRKIDFYKVNFTNIFNLNIKNLNILSLSDCRNINLYSDDLSSKLQILTIMSMHFENNTMIIKFPLLKRAILHNTENFNIFDYTSLINLKKLKINFKQFFHINNSPLEDIDIYNYRECNIYQALEKLIKIKSIKIAHLSLDNLQNSHFSKIKGFNNNLKYLYLIINHTINELDIHNLIILFPNLKILHFEYYTSKKEKLSNKLIIEENNNTKIDKLHISLGDYNFGNLIFYINSFSNLIEFTLTCSKVNENLFPLFRSKCEKIFHSLKILSINTKGIELDVFNNLINNIDKCIILQNFSVNTENLNITKENYDNSINKILTYKNITYIDIQIKWGKYWWSFCLIDKKIYVESDYNQNFNVKVVDKEE